MSNQKIKFLTVITLTISGSLLANENALGIFRSEDACNAAINYKLSTERGFLPGSTVRSHTRLFGTMADPCNSESKLPEQVQEALVGCFENNEGDWYAAYVSRDVYFLKYASAKGSRYCYSTPYVSEFRSASFETVVERKSLFNALRVQRTKATFTTRTAEAAKIRYRRLKGNTEPSAVTREGRVCEYTNEGPGKWISGQADNAWNGERDAIPQFCDEFEPSEKRHIIDKVVGVIDAGVNPGK